MTTENTHPPATNLIHTNNNSNNTMAMTASERLQAWQELDNPKPDWQTFKRMMGQFNNNTSVVQSLWAKTKHHNESLKHNTQPKAF